MLQITGQSIQTTSTMKMINRKKVKGHITEENGCRLQDSFVITFKILLQMLYKKIKSTLLLIVIYLHHVMLYIVSSQLLRPESHNTVMGSHAWFWPKRLQRRLCNWITSSATTSWGAFIEFLTSFLLCLVHWDFSCFIGREESISILLKRLHYIEFSSVLPVVLGLNFTVPCSHCNLFVTVWSMREYLKNYWSIIARIARYLIVQCKVPHFISRTSLWMASL